MKLCNCSGTIYTNTGTNIPFKLEAAKPSDVIKLVKDIKDFYAHKTEFDSMGVTIGTVMADLTQTIAVDFEVIEEFEGDEKDEN